MLDLVGNPENRFSHNEAHLPVQMQMAIFIREADGSSYILVCTLHTSHTDLFMQARDQYRIFDSILNRLENPLTSI